MRLEIRVERGHLLASLRNRSGVTWGAGCAASTPDALHAGLAEMLALAPIRRASPRVQVLIGAPVVQCRLLHGLPKVGQRDLVTLVARHPGRYFRKNGIPLVTNARWAGRRSPQVSGSAISVAVEEPWITAIEAALEKHGGLPYHIVPAEQPSLALRSVKAQARLQQWERRRCIRLAVGCGLVWLAAGAVSVLRQQLDLRWLRQEQVHLAPAAAAVLEARQRLHEAMTSVSAIRDHESHRTAVLASLTAVLDALPDTAYLRGFQWNADGSGSVNGAGPDAAEVLAHLEAISMLQRPQLQGPAERDPQAGTGQERFDIRFGATEP
jgi:hypothetical protein